MKKDRFRWNLSFFHWCVDTNQCSARIQISAHTLSYAHTRVYFAEKFLVHLSPPEPAAHEYSSVWGGVCGWVWDGGWGMGYGRVWGRVGYGGWGMEYSRVR